MVDVDWSKRACADIHKHQDESVEGEDGCICSLEVVFFGGGRCGFSTYQRLFPTPAPHPRPPTV